MSRQYRRKDLHLGPVHVILRAHDGSPQYGLIAWSIQRMWTLDVWAHHYLVTLRRREQ